MPRFRAVDHVRKREEFEQVYQQGVRTAGRLMLLFVKPNGLTHPRLGIAATRKLGSAVVRNRTNRLVREVFRPPKPAGGYDLVVVPRREMLEAPYDAVEAEFRNLYDRRSRPGRRADDGRTRRDRRDPHL